MKKSLLVLSLLAATSVQAQNTNTAILTWVGPTAYSDGTPVTPTYNIYQGLKGATKTKIASGIVPQTYTASSGLLSGKDYCWDITAVDGTVESAHSAEACKSFPAATLPAPTGASAK